MAERFRLDPVGPFDLAASNQFIEGFPPAGQPTSGTDDLVLALLTDDWRAVTVRVWQTPGRVLGEVVAGDADHDVLRAQLARVLSLDIDGSGFSDIADGDDVLGGMTTLYPGLRPVLFPTPFEAACWSVLSQRTRMSHAAEVRDRLAARHGTAMAVGDRTVLVFPSPEAVLAVRDADGVSATKLGRLHSVAAAATEGVLDAAALRAMTVDDALDQLQQINGIGPFGAELIVVRGAGAPDVFPSRERRLHQAMAELYDLGDPSVDDLAEIADGWRPYRSWAALLLRTWWEQHRR